MSIGSLVRTPQRIRRFTRIVQVAAKYGFGYLVHWLNLGRFLPSAAWLKGRLTRTGSGTEDISRARRLVLMLEELGPTYVKLGQLLSTRPDLVPEEYVQELRRLQDHVAPFDPAVARRVIETALGAPMAELFADFTDQPLASGSIGQAHLARLHSGEEVVVKVKRPGIDQTVKADLDLLEMLADRAEQIEELRAFRPRMLVDEFARSLERELDFVTEGSYTEKFRELFAENEKVHVPRVFWDQTCSSVLTIERLGGVSIGRTDELLRMGVSLPELATTVADTFLYQYFERGLFHADPHPGNIMVNADGSIGIIDFGMVGHLDDEMRGLLGTGLIALVRREFDVVVDVYAEMGALPDDVDYEALKAGTLEMLDKYYGIPIKLVDMQRAFSDVMRIARAHRVIFPRGLVLMGKSLVMASSLARQLDPEFNIARVARPYALGLVREKISPLRNAKLGLTLLWQLSNLLRKLPRDTRRLVRKVLGGRLQLVLRIPELTGLGVELDRATNRLAFSIIVGSIILGSSVLIHAKIRPHFEDLPWLGQHLAKVMPQLSVLGALGYCIAFVMGLVLVWGIWRSGKL